ncbi:tRNA 2-thiouridine synthesizing protein B [Desulfobaculum xiamenense]|uniref:tRNA 2-thiouridine synthesizing protein B n=1 Tax=Desulfobaculum xiamenense TaxID=995050 RepID=A0A846QH93_9BACT|nr:DsrH/TusB family sulfur relay protein [Desulfobaculum xiamenense]NJB66490.1 tRNA 2-thiouridine synthesizing protein B [Desulfobaculum xiamenense]
MNKPDVKMLDRVRMIGGDEEKLLLLVGDAVTFATPFFEERLEELDVDEVFAAKDAVEARNLELSDECSVVDYDEMVDLLLTGGEKVISL